MLNLHARELERILLDRKLTIIKEPALWTISGGSKAVHYAPNTGKCWHWTPGTEGRKQERLRGSATRVAEIIEGLVR
jgi:hypothetical protein